MHWKEPRHPLYIYIINWEHTGTDWKHTRPSSVNWLLSMDMDQMFFVDLQEGVHWFWVLGCGWYFRILRDDQIGAFTLTWYLLRGQSCAFSARSWDLHVPVSDKLGTPAGTKLEHIKMPRRRTGAREHKKTLRSEGCAPKTESSRAAPPGLRLQARGKQTHLFTYLPEVHFCFQKNASLAKSAPNPQGGNLIVHG